MQKAADARHAGVCALETSSFCSDACSGITVVLPLHRFSAVAMTASSSTGLREHVE